MRLFLATSDYCFGYPDFDDEGTYDPTRECFHIGLGMLGASNESEGVGNRAPLRQGAGDATPPLLEPRAAWNENAAPKELRRLDLEQLRELQAKVNQDRLLLSSSKTLSSKSSEVAVMAEEPSRGPTTSTTASITTKGVSNPQSSIALARMSQQQRC